MADQDSGSLNDHASTSDSSSANATNSDSLGEATWENSGANDDSNEEDEDGSLDGGSASEGPTLRFDIGFGDIGHEGGSMGDDGDCSRSFTMRVRDFHSRHRDFFWNDKDDFASFVGVQKGVLADELVHEAGDDRWLPAYALGQGPGDFDPTYGPFSGPENFHHWYHDVPGENHATDVTLELIESGEGTLVFDDASFHPIAADFGFGSEGFSDNFLFTTETVLFFEYRGDEVFQFRGDDDIWVYVNHKLAIDLGGLHLATSGSIDLGLQGDAFGLVPGETHPIHIFHAERNPGMSNFRIETRRFCFDDPPER